MRGSCQQGNNEKFVVTEANEPQHVGGRGHADEACCCVDIDMGLDGVHTEDNGPFSQACRLDQLRAAVQAGAPQHNGCGNQKFLMLQIWLQGITTGRLGVASISNAAVCRLSK